VGISLSFLNQLTPYSIILKRNKIILHHITFALVIGTEQILYRFEIELNFLCNAYCGCV